MIESNTLRSVTSVCLSRVNRLTGGKDPVLLRVGFKVDFTLSEVKTQYVMFVDDVGSNQVTQ